MKRKLLFVPALIILLLGLTKTAQSLDLSTDTSNLPIKVRYMAFRPALWEEKALIEEINEKRNLG